MTAPGHTTTGHPLLPLWFGFLGPPIIWAARFGASYALVPYACDRGAVALLQGITLAALLGVAWAGVVAWKAWKAAGKTSQVEVGGRDARTRFMALAGLLGSAIFFAAIVAEAIPLFLIDPCQTGGTPL